ncbi:MAG: GMC oxidoreductase, partial [Gemmatimonadota bacterium]
CTCTPGRAPRPGAAAPPRRIVHPPKERSSIPAGGFDYDVVVVGSGFGGTMAARPLVEAGLDVLVVERGPWVPRGEHNWEPDGTLEVTPYHSKDGLHRDGSSGPPSRVGTAACVGGPSVFYGGVSFRFREGDFEPPAEITGDSGARWPLGYRDLRPHYRRAERVLGVSGVAGDDPVGPERRAPYPAEPGELTPVSRRLAETARGMGLRPFRLPLAINHGRDDARAECVACNTCDTFACAVGAKNDLAVAVLPELMRKGLELRPNTAVTGLRSSGGRVRELELRDRRTATRHTVTARGVVLAAGALRERSPAADSVGRYLTRHCSAIAFGFFPEPAEGWDRFHKQIGLNDFYFGDDRSRGNGGKSGRRWPLGNGGRSAPGGRPPSKLGNIQQVQTPANGVIRSALPDLAADALEPAARRLVGLLALAEDSPRAENRVELHPSRKDEAGLPELVIRHRYAERDLAAREALLDRARKVLGRAGALFCYTHEIETFSHALGTVRMGEDPSADPLTPGGRYRGIENLWVTDGSALPTAGGVNPSLTIAANALRIGEGIAERLAAEREEGRVSPAPQRAGGRQEGGRPEAGE